MLSKGRLTVPKLNFERQFPGRYRKFSKLAFVGIVMTIASVTVISSTSDPAAAQGVVPVRPVPFGSYGNPGNTYGTYGNPGYSGGNYLRGYSNLGTPYGTYGNPGYSGGNYLRGYSNLGTPYGTYSNPGYSGGNYPGGYGNPGNVVPYRPVPYGGYGRQGTYGGYGYSGGNYPGRYDNPGNAYGDNGYRRNFNNNPYAPYVRQR